MPQKPIMHTEKLQLIQFYRAIAVIMVVISHVMWEIKGMRVALGLGFDDKFIPGDCGVDLFFVISGFIMVYTTQQSAKGWASAIDFVKRRVARIVPLYWTMTTLMIMALLLFPASVQTATRLPLDWLYSYLFIPFARQVDGLARPVLGLGWSLNYEMFFYGLFALGLLLPRIYGLLFTIVGLCFLTIGEQYFHFHITALSVLTQPIILEFGFGVMIGWMYVSSIRMPRAVGIIATVIGVVGLFMAPEYSEELAGLRHLFYGIPALLIIAAATLTRNADEMQVPRLAVTLGDISYSSYLTHPFILGLLTLCWQLGGLNAMMGSAAGIGLYGGVAVVTSMLVAWVVHVYYDVPVSNLLRRLLLGNKRGKKSVVVDNQAVA